MINKALRTQEHLTLYTFRLFIRDLHMQLAHLQNQKKAENSKLILYRGQGIPPHDLDKIRSNRGGLLSINTFFSTSKDENVGLFYAQASVGDPHTETVLFKIKNSLC